MPNGIYLTISKKEKKMKKMAKISALTLILTIAIALPLTLAGCGGGRSINLDYLEGTWNVNQYRWTVSGQNSTWNTGSLMWATGSITLVENDDAPNTLTTTGTNFAIITYFPLLTTSNWTINEDNNTLTIVGDRTWEIRQLTATRLVLDHQVGTGSARNGIRITFHAA